MSKDQRKLLDRMLEGQTAPALRQFRELANDSTSEVQNAGVVQPAEEVLSIWSVRLWNALMRGRRIIGLADLVRSLRRLSPQQPVEQISLTSGLKTGLAFFDSETRLPIGAVISVRSEADVRHSRENYEVAMGMAVPAPSAQPIVDWSRHVQGKKLKASLAALTR